MLDRKLEGGLPAGSVVALTAPPASQSELLLHEFAAPRRTLYLTTERSAKAVREAFDGAAVPTSTPEVEELTGEAPLDRATELAGTLAEGSTLIVDPVDPLERRDSARYRRFVNGLRARLVDTESIAVLHCLAGRSPPAGRDLTEHMADVVFALDTRVSGESVENRLAVPKFRGGRALPETIKLELTERVRIDTSRDIA